MKYKLRRKQSKISIVNVYQIMKKEKNVSILVFI